MEELKLFVHSKPFTFFLMIGWGLGSTKTIFVLFVFWRILEKMNGLAGFAVNMF